jgi:hypothetical protein
MLQPKGAPFRERIKSLEIIMATLAKTFKAQRTARKDPLASVRSKLKNEQQARLGALEADVQLEIEAVVKLALNPGGGGAR